MDPALLSVVLRGMITLFENRRKEAEAKKLGYPTEMIKMENELRQQLVALANKPSD